MRKATGEPCSPHLTEGDRDTARRLASENLDLFMDLGVNYIVTDCVGCQLQLARGLREAGMRQQVLHLMELRGRATPQ